MVFLESVIQSLKETNPKLTGALKPGVEKSGFARMHQRDLTTWPVNSLWTEFLIDMGIDDSDATCAAEQVAAFLQAMRWAGAKDEQGFWGCIQLWYFGMPVEKVRTPFIELAF
jgi:hypothetical protein